ncbi:acyl-CoA desaturase [Mesorhizobium sp. M0036]|uniref:acyl-CoA desaturase n=1 Tax=Mesorhizobium sp. M0036 TaxID=2956853 RepID=UPI00333B9604
MDNVVESGGPHDAERVPAATGRAVIRDRRAVRTQRIAATLTVLVPTLATAYAIGLGWQYGVSLLDICLFFGFYLLTLVGVTVGFHRLLAHRAFTADRWVKLALIVLGTWSAQGPVLHWVSNHRRHHMSSDSEDDPHSPNLSGKGIWGRFKGLCYAHIGSMFAPEVTNYVRFGPDLLRDPDIVKLNRHYLLIVVLGLLLPAAIGAAVSQSLWGAWTGMLWGGFVRMFVVHHAIWSITSLAHTFGEKVFASDDESRNSAWLALLTGGEGWHNTHHAFPKAAIFSTSSRQIDIGGVVVWSLEKLGAVRGVHRVSPDGAKTKSLL